MNFVKHALALVANIIAGICVYAVVSVGFFVASFLVVSMFQHVTDPLGYFLLGFSSAVGLFVQIKFQAWFEEFLNDRVFLFY